MDLRTAVVTFVVPHLLGGAAWAAPSLPPQQQPPLDVRVPAGAPPVPALARAEAPRLRVTVRQGWAERGIEASREALVACQQGSHPGAAVGTAQLGPSAGRTNAQPDHCFRF